MRLLWISPALLLAALLSATAVFAQAGHVIEVINQGQEPIVELYVISQSAQTWGNDMLRGQPLQATKARTISINVSCPCKVKAIYNDGAVRYGETSGSNPVVFNH